MHDIDVIATVDAIQARAEEDAEAAIRDILQDKHPGKEFKLSVKAAIAYTVVWAPGSMP